jgi:uncharacterized protein (DUF952 family)
MAIGAKEHSKYKGEEIKAFCYIYKDKEEKNKCLLTDQHLVILLKNTENSFPLNQIVNIQLENRYSMFPLIAGGIVLPLSLVAIFNNLYDPWILIYLMIIGGLSFYMGWLGHPVISIISKGSINDTLHLKNISESLRTFINFTNEVVKMGINDELKAPHIYHVVNKKDWEEQKFSKQYAPPSLQSEGFIHCSQKEQLAPTIKRFFSGQTDLWVLHIDPLKVKAQIKYEPAEDAQGLFPHIYGVLNLDAVVKVEHWK